MRYLFRLFFALPLFACCTRQEGSLIRDESDKPDYRDYWKRELSEHPSPKIAIKQADAYFNSLSFAKRTPHRDKIRVEFSRGFFSGFTNPVGNIVGAEHDANWHGFKAGQDYRVSSPEKLNETMEAFGYRKSEAEGTWTVGFERNSFQPRGRTSQEEWWISALGDIESDLPTDLKISDTGVSIRVTGFLSPKGQYGHLGAYDREFYATKISRIIDSYPRP